MKYLLLAFYYAREADDMELHGSHWAVGTYNTIAECHAAAKEDFFDSALDLWDAMLGGDADDSELAQIQKVYTENMETFDIDESALKLHVPEVILENDYTSDYFREAYQYSVIKLND